MNSAWRSGTPSSNVSESAALSTTSLRETAVSRCLLQKLVLVYAFVVGKVARAPLLDTLYKTISSSLQTVSVVSGTPATEFIRLHGIEILSELRLVYHSALRRLFCWLFIRS